MTKAKFVKTACLPEEYPALQDSRGNLFPEIAICGRSNVGKSSLINFLFRSKLAKTSSTPGKTQFLNFFLLDEKTVFADLPGYGYANVPAQVKKTWGPMVQTYLEQRTSLKLILFLMDIRRLPTKEDLQFLKWVMEKKKAALLVLTKVDKVTPTEQNQQTKKILNALGCENLHVVHTSIPQNCGREKLFSMIHQALTDEMEESEWA